MQLASAWVPEPVGPRRRPKTAKKPAKGPAYWQHPQVINAHLQEGRNSESLRCFRYPETSFTPAKKVRLQTPLKKAVQFDSTPKIKYSLTPGVYGLPQHAQHPVHHLSKARPHNMPSGPLDDIYACHNYMLNQCNPYCPSEPKHYLFSPYNVLRLPTKKTSDRRNYG